MAERSKFRLLRALLEGAASVARRPGLVIIVWLVAFLFALVGAVGLGEEVRSSVGHSGLADDMRGSIDLGLIEELTGGSDGLASTIQPVRLSAAALFDNVDAWVSGKWISGHRSLIGWGCLFVLAWVFLQGGAVEQLVAGHREFQMRVFFASSGEFFWRFLRLSLLTGLGYYGVYRIGHAVFPWIEEWTVDVTSERTVLTLYLAAALVVVALLSLLHLIADYAKIALVRHRRRSSVLAAVSALFQVLRHPVQTFGLLAVSASLLLALQLVHVWASPPVAWRSLAALITTFLLGQLYLLARWALRLVRLSAEIRLAESWTGTRGDHRR